MQQLEVYFGQYLPQLFVSALTPVLIFAFVAFLDLLCIGSESGRCLRVADYVRGPIGHRGMLAARAGHKEL
jgi:hypothetical protein